MFAVIGLGKFGESVVKELVKAKEDVIAVDSDEHRVDAVKNLASRAVILDSTNVDALQTAGIQECSAAIVSIGRDLSAAILTIIALNELGVKKIIAKALSQGASKALIKVGATSTVFPEEEMGVVVARRMRNPNALELVSCGPEHSIVEIVAPEKFRGKTIKDLNLLPEKGILVIGRLDEANKVELALTADYVLNETDRLIIAGKTKDITKFSKES